MQLPNVIITFNFSKVKIKIKDFCKNPIICKFYMKISEKFG